MSEHGIGNLAAFPAERNHGLKEPGRCLSKTDSICKVTVRLHIKVTGSCEDAIETVCFQVHLQGCWLDSGPHRLSGLWFLSGNWLGVTASSRTVLSQNERTQYGNYSIWIFSEENFQHFHSVVSVRSKSIYSSTFQERVLHLGENTTPWDVIESHHGGFVPLPLSLTMLKWKLCMCLCLLTPNSSSFPL